jgi:hypothetical protein
MKNVVLLFAFLLVSTLSFSQWQQVGDDIIGPIEGDYYGADVSLSASGNRIATFNGDRENGLSGEVQVYEFTGGSWSQIGQTVPGVSGTKDAGNIGNVRLNADGDRFVFGNPFSDVNNPYEGAVRVFEFQNGSWVQLGQVILGDNEYDKLGASVDITAAGDRIVVSASKRNPMTIEDGFARVYELQGTNWVQIGQNIDSTDGASMSVSISANGEVIAVAEPVNSESEMFAGKVRTLRLQNNTWQQIGGVIFGENAGDRVGIFPSEAGSSINLNTDGSVLAVGAYNYNQNNEKGQIRIFQFQNNQWVLVGTPITGTSGDSFFGGSLELSGDGNTIVIGDSDAARLYTLEGGDWQQKNTTLGGLRFKTTINAAGTRIGYGNLFFNANNSVGKVAVYNDGPFLGLTNFENNNFIKLYPNPNNGIFDITFSENQQRVTVNIIDLLGRQVVTIDYFNTNTIEINENLKAGVYLVEILANGVSETVRIAVE